MASYQQLVAECKAANDLRNEMDCSYLFAKGYAALIDPNLGHGIIKATALISVGIAGYNAMKAADNATAARIRVVDAWSRLNNNSQ